MENEVINERKNETRSKVLLFVIGVLVGAVIATGAFVAYTLTTNNSGGQTMQMPGGTPPEMPGGQSNSNNQSGSNSQDNSNGQSSSNSQSGNNQNSQPPEKPSGDNSQSSSSQSDN